MAARCWAKELVMFLGIINWNLILHTVARQLAVLVYFEFADRCLKADNTGWLDASTNPPHSNSGNAGNINLPMCYEVVLGIS